MFIRYDIENDTSFVDHSTLSLHVPNTRSRIGIPDHYVNPGHDGLEVMKEAAIFGHNGAGKSNFISSLRFLQSLFQTIELPRTKNAYVKWLRAGNHSSIPSLQQ